MGKGTDLAREIINMVNEYNRVIRSREHEIICYKDDVHYLKQKVDAYEKTLETVTDLICRNIHKCIDGEYYINLWSDRSYFNKLIEALDITLDVSKTESEEGENED